MLVTLACLAPARHNSRRTPLASPEQRTSTTISPGPVRACRRAGAWSARPQGDSIHNPNDRYTYSIYAIAKNGGAVVTLADGVWLPKQLAVDDRFVYWASYGTVIKDPQVASDGKIERVDKDGMNRVILASGLSGPTSVAVDDSFVYFTESGLAAGNSSSGVRRVPKDGGTVQRLYNVVADMLVVNGDDLYLLAGNLSSGKTTITQTAKNGGQIKRAFNDSLIINPTMTIFDGRIYYYTETKNWLECKKCPFYRSFLRVDATWGGRNDASFGFGARA